MEGSPSRDGTASGRKPDGRALPLNCCQRTRQTPARRLCTEPTYQPASRSPRVAFEPISSGRPLLAADTIRGDDHSPNCLGLGAQRSPHRPAGRRCASLARPAIAARALVRRATSGAHPSVCAAFILVGGTSSAQEDCQRSAVPPPRAEPLATRRSRPYRPCIGRPDRLSFRRLTAAARRQHAAVGSRLLPPHMSTPPLPSLVYR